MVSSGYRGGKMPYCGYLVADRDRRHHDYAVTRCVPAKPGSATVPFFGVDAAVLSEEGKEVEAGILSIRKPWPGMLRGIYGDKERYKQTYWSKWPGKYFPGDGARKDSDGYFWILGRIDDVVNVAGHRIGTAELESIFVEHPGVAESAVIGIDHEIKGKCLVGFITLKEGVIATEALEKELKEWAGKKIGRFAIPDKIIFSADLPKTRSGKNYAPALKGYRDRTRLRQCYYFSRS